MALFTNNKNVDLRLLVGNDELLILDSSISAKNVDDTLEILKLVGPISEAAPKIDKPLGFKQNIITSASVSNSGKYFVACDSSSVLHLWEHKHDNSNRLSSRSLARKCQKVILSNSGEDIILADRGGDVYRFSVQSYNDPGVFLLGHISFILDVCISSNDKYLATCDRDCKIRVSRYPNCYNIVSYCLGHQEFVSSIQFVALPEEMLLSSSGDGSVRLWKYKEGTEEKNVSFCEDSDLCKLAVCKDEKANDKLVHESVSNSNSLSEKQILFSVRCIKYCAKNKLIAVLFYLKPGIAVYELPNGLKEDLVLKQYIPLASPPLDAFFTDEEQLLVLVNQNTPTLVCFEYNTENRLFSETTDGEDSLVLKQIKALYSHCVGLENFQDDFVSMFKRVYENSVDDEEDERRKKNKNQ